MRENSYGDVLPAGNITFEAAKDLYIRAAAAKVMARPALGNLSPQISAISIPDNGNLVGGSPGVPAVPGMALSFGIRGAMALPR